MFVSPQKKATLADKLEIRIISDLPAWSCGCCSYSWDLLSGKEHSFHFPRLSAAGGNGSAWLCTYILMSAESRSLKSSQLALRAVQDVAADAAAISTPFKGHASPLPSTASSHLSSSSPTLNNHVATRHFHLPPAVGHRNLCDAKTQCWPSAGCCESVYSTYTMLEAIAEVYHQIQDWTVNLTPKGPIYPKICTTIY